LTGTAVCLYVWGNDNTGLTQMAAEETAKRKKYDHVVMAAALQILGLRTRQAVHFRIHQHKSKQVRAETKRLLNQLQKLYKNGTAAALLASHWAGNDRKADSN